MDRPSGGTRFSQLKVAIINQNVRSRSLLTSPESGLERWTPGTLKCRAQQLESLKIFPSKQTLTEIVSKPA